MFNSAFRPVGVVPVPAVGVRVTRGAGMKLDYLVRSGIVKPRPSFGMRETDGRDGTRRASRIAVPVAPAVPQVRQVVQPARTAVPQRQATIGGPSGSASQMSGAATPAVAASKPVLRRGPMPAIPGPAPAKPIPAAVTAQPAARSAPAAAIPAAVVAKPIPKPRVLPEDPSSRRRTKRKTSAIPCILAFAGLRLQLSARILDMSVGGACVHLPQAAKNAYDGDVDSLPERLTLHIRSDHMAYEGRIAWRSNDRIGIQFTSPPKFTR